MDILEVSLLSNDIPSTRSFYAEVLKLPVSSHHPRNVSIVAGSTKLIFNYVEGIEPVYHFAFNIPASQLNNVIRYLQARLEIMPASENGGIIADFKSWNARSVYFNDNNGNILECVARFDLDELTSGVEAGSFILNISEIGVVTENVSEAENLLHRSGIPLYSKGPQQEDFSVLGDDNGLIILKDKHRGWMPNDLLPQRFDLTAIIRQHDQLFKLTLNDGLNIAKLDQNEAFYES
ncbi:hypothetical protein GZH53_10005 [Flavihumibacter sp. R14]|nr:hypothetical protein [Flavihumibacter soli]